MEQTITAQLTAFNQTYKEMDEIYHVYAKANGLSDATLWVLYSLWERGEGYPQRELCADWFYPPQTVNSILKGLERRGLIELVLIPGNRKSKQVCLTSSGRALAKQVIVPLVEAERSSFSGLSAEERAALLSITEKHIALLKRATKKLSSEDCSPQ